MELFVGGHSDAVSQEDLLASGDQTGFRFSCMRSKRKLRGAFFVAIAPEFSILGEVSDLAVGGVISQPMGIPDVSYGFVNFNVIYPEFWCAEGGGVSD